MGLRLTPLFFPSPLFCSSPPSLLFPLSFSIAPCLGCSVVTALHFAVLQATSSLWCWAKTTCWPLWLSITRVGVSVEVGRKLNRSLENLSVHMWFFKHGYWCMYSLVHDGTEFVTVNANSRARFCPCMPYLCVHCTRHVSVYVCLLLLLSPSPSA